jgi:hypothetical protein
MEKAYRRKVILLKAVFRIRMGSGFNWVSGFGPGLGIRIQAGKNGPQKKGKKLGNFMFEESALKRFKAIYMTVYQQIVHLICVRNFVIINHGLGPDPD